MHAPIVSVMRKAVIGGLAMALLAGVAVPAAATHHSVGETKAEKSKPKKRPCPFRRSINGWNSLKGSRRHVVLSAGTSDYLLTLSAGCTHIDFSETIAIKSTPSVGLCVTKGDIIIARHHQRCFITDIEEVKDVKEAQAIVDARLAEEKGEDADDNGEEADSGETEDGDGAE